MAPVHDGASFVQQSANEAQRPTPFGLKTALHSQVVVPTLAEALKADAPLRAQGAFFWEFFAGKAGLTEAVHVAGVPVLPPIDIESSSWVPVAVDIVDADQWRSIMRVLALAVVFFLHCGTPCNTFTSARKNDGGPPPLRSQDEPMGLPDLKADDDALVFLGNLFLLRSAEASALVFFLGGNFSIENPLLSLLWETHVMHQLVRDTRSLALDFDQCAFGTPWVKPTRLLCSTTLLDDVCVRCPGNHVHQKLKGRVWDEAKQCWVYRTKQAQVYPFALCATMASAIAGLFTDPLAHFAPTFQLCISTDDRKRELYSTRPWKVHRQSDSAQKALAAGYQMKRGAVKPLLEIELEPGEAVQWALQIPHPFTQILTLDPMMEKNIAQVCADPVLAVRLRQDALHFWHQRAVHLLPDSISMIKAQPDAALRRLLLGCEDPGQAQLGQVCHVALYAEMLRACESVDSTLPDFLLHGFPIVGTIAPTGRWPPYEKDQKALPVEAAL